MIPIGRGQRELIIGDRQTGKTAVAIDTIINQKYTHSAEAKRMASSQCIVSMWRSAKRHPRSRSFVEARREWRDGHTRRSLRRAASDPAPLQFIAPYSGATLGEHFRDTGRHALVIYDDLSKQAQLIAKFRCCFAVHQDAKHIPATCSIFTHVCSSALRSFRPNLVAVRLPRFRSSKRRQVTYPHTFRRT